jgi:rare lipoprotein A
MRVFAGLCLGLAGAVGGCDLFHFGGPAPAPHYVVGSPYQAGGVWRYPHERFEDTETGVASVSTARSGLTADGEAVEPTAMTAQHPTLQLPSVVQVMNLDTGAQTLVRVNDRGPANPGRVIALSPRAAQLLGVSANGTRVRVQVMESESRRLAASYEGASAAPSGETRPAAPVLAAAPAGTVTQETLSTPGGAKAAPGQAKRLGPAPSDFTAPAPVPQHLPETVTRAAPHPGSLYVEAGAVQHLDDAEMLRARLASLGAEIQVQYDQPSELAYRVRIGPLSSVAAADAKLAEVIAAGVPGARITAP